jgi:hypothetical protein
MMKETKLNRVNVIVTKNPDGHKVIRDWSPILQSAGIEMQRDGFHDSMALYCHEHTLRENEMAMNESVAGDITGPPGPPRPLQGMLSSVPAQIIPSALPVIINIVRDLDILKNMRIHPISFPSFILLIEDNQYFDTVDTIDCDYEIPAMSVRDTQTNLFEIYQDRMVEHFRSELKKYLESVPNADTLIVLSFGEMFFINDMDGQMNPKMKVRFRFRVKALEDATYIPKKKEDEKPKPKLVKIEELVEKEQEKSWWQLNLPTEPSKFKKWIARVFLGASFYQDKED